MKIFVAGAFFLTSEQDTRVYQDIARMLSSIRGVEVYQPIDIENYRQQYKKAHPKDSKATYDRIMVDYDLKLIKDSDLIIADVSNKSTGLGIELGTAKECGNKIEFIAKKGSQISNMVFGAFPDQEVQYYNDIDDLKKIVYKLVTDSQLDN